MSGHFVLDLAENPHPKMLAGALSARFAAKAYGGPVNEAWWAGYLAAMCDATGETPAAIEAWMDRAVPRDVERTEGA